MICLHGLLDLHSTQKSSGSPPLLTDIDDWVPHCLKPDLAITLLPRVMSTNLDTIGSEGVCNISSYIYSDNLPSLLYLKVQAVVASRGFP